MRILADENIPRMTVEHLRQLGHDVRDVRGTQDEGMEDTELWSAALAERRALITTDRGFTEFRTVPHNGILIVRLRNPIVERYTTR
jgi:predicted nuclease of predicted toxin-antitoxin system